MSFKLFSHVTLEKNGTSLFSIGNSILHLSLRLLREDVNFRLKIAKKLLTR